MTKRKYRNTAQAEVAELTRKRIIQAALAMIAEQWMDAMTLDQVAERAGVTVQTLLRHFGSKEGLMAHAGQAANQAALSQRAEAPVGDLAGAVDNLITHYEEIGDRVIRLLSQEERYPQLKELMQPGRVAHQQWVQQVFRPQLDRRPSAEREGLAAQLSVTCDVYVWKLLRRDLGYSVDEYRTILLAMLAALLGERTNGK